MEGEIREPNAERYFALLKVNKINFDDQIKEKQNCFDNLTPLYPNEELLEVET